MRTDPLTLAERLNQLRDQISYELEVARNGLEAAEATADTQRRVIAQLEAQAAELAQMGSPPF